MCKNLMIVGIKPHKQDELGEFMLAMAPIMTAGDRDGLGYAAMTEGGLHGERWWDPQKAFKYRKPWTTKDEELKKSFCGTLEGDPQYNFFCEKPGINSEAKIAVIMHARLATCEKALKNVHPFYREGTALIHNGLVHDAPGLRQITSTCDSEYILNSYVDNSVNKDPDNIKKVGESLRGSYTCGVLTRDKDGNPILDIFRSSPNLWAGYINELDALVFCTSSQMVVDACKELKWKVGSFFRVKDDKMLRIDARTGRFLSSHDFKSSFYTQTNYGSGGYHGWHGYSDSEWDQWESSRGTGRKSGGGNSNSGAASSAPVPSDNAGTSNNSVVQSETPAVGAYTQEERELALAYKQPEKKSLPSRQCSASRISPKMLEFAHLRTLGTSKGQFLEVGAAGKLEELSDPFFVAGEGYRH